MQVNSINNSTNFKALDYSKLGKYEKAAIKELLPRLEEMAKGDDIVLSTVCSPRNKALKALKIEVAPTKEYIEFRNLFGVKPETKERYYDITRLIESGKQGKPYNLIVNLVKNVKNGL